METGMKEQLSVVFKNYICTTICNMPSFYAVFFEYQLKCITDTRKNVEYYRPLRKKNKFLNSSIFCLFGWLVVLFLGSIRFQIILLAINLKYYQYNCYRWKAINSKGQYSIVAQIPIYLKIISQFLKTALQSMMQIFYYI